MIDMVLDFQKIHADFRPRIERYLTRLVGEYEAEDLTQEVFLRVSQALHTFKGESKLSTWIYRIATNAAMDKLRSSSFKRMALDGQRRAPEFNEMALEEEYFIASDEPPSVEQQLCHRERYECYRDHIKSLPANYRMVVALSELKELAVNEIAEILGLSVDVVKIRLHRGRTRLLQELKNHCKAEDWL